MKNLFFLTILLLTFSCQKEVVKPIVQKQSNEVLINGKIENYTLSDSIGEVTLYINRTIQNDQYSTTFAIDSAGEFSGSFNMDRQQDIYLRYKNTLRLLVKPSDSISVSFDGSLDNDKDFLQSIKVSGTSEELNADFIAYQAQNIFDHKLYYNKVQIASTENYKKFYDSLFAQRNSNIKTFLSKNPNTSAVLKNWLFVEEHYTPLDFLLGYPLDYSMYHNVQPTELELSDSFYEDLNNLPPLTEDHLVNSVLKHIGNRYHYHFLFDLAKPGEKKDPQVLNTQIIETIVSKNKDNPIMAQIAINDRINSLLDNNSVEIIDNNQKTLDSLYNGTDFKKNITEKYTTTKNRLENPELPQKAQLLTFSSENPDDFLDEIIKNANGKVVYIDNWATWCGPCKQEFKTATPELKKKFGETVEFVYLCHKSDEKLWKPTISEYQIEGKHYFVTDEQFNALQEQLNITGFPTYNIIDKKGNILHSGFEFRPSIDETHSILTQLIN